MKRRVQNLQNFDFQLPEYCAKPQESAMMPYSVLKKKEMKKNLCVSFDDTEKHRSKSVMERPEKQKPKKT